MFPTSLFPMFYTNEMHFNSRILKWFILIYIVTVDTVKLNKKSLALQLFPPKTLDTTTIVSRLCKPTSTIRLVQSWRYWFPLWTNVRYCTSVLTRVDNCLNSWTKLSVWNEIINIVNKLRNVNVNFWSAISKHLNYKNNDRITWEFY